MCFKCKLHQKRHQILNVFSTPKFVFLKVNFLEEYMNQNDSLSKSKKEMGSNILLSAVIFRLKDKTESNYRKLPQKKLQIFLTNQSNNNGFGLVETPFDFQCTALDALKLHLAKKYSLKECFCEELCSFAQKNLATKQNTFVNCFCVLTNQNQKLENGEWFDVDLLQNANKLQTENGFSIFSNQSVTLTSGNRTLKNNLDIYVDRQGLREDKSVVVRQTSIAPEQIKVVCVALEKLKQNLQRSADIFNLLPQKFTLTELKNSFECILGKKLLDANFRRKVAKMVLPIQEYTNGKGHRSSQFFKFNPLYTFFD